MAESLNDFLKRRQAEGGQEPTIDWARRKQTWLEALEALYGQILDWLKPSIDNALVASSREQSTLHEEHIGQYSAPSLVLNFGDATIRFRPVGTLVVGAQGRVDMLGGTEGLSLLRTKDGWSFMKRARDGRPKTWRLDEESFGEVLRSMLE